LVTLCIKILDGTHGTHVRGTKQDVQIRANPKTQFGLIHLVDESKLRHFSKGF